MSAEHQVNEPADEQNQTDRQADTRVTPGAKRLGQTLGQVVVVWNRFLKGILQ